MKALLAGKSRKAVAILVSLVVATAATTISFAGDGDKGDGAGSVPGVPVVGGRIRFFAFNARGWPPDWWGHYKLFIFRPNDSDKVHPSLGVHRQDGRHVCL